MSTKLYQCTECDYHFAVKQGQLSTADLKIHCDNLMQVRELSAPATHILAMLDKQPEMGQREMLIEIKHKYAEALETLEEFGFIEEFEQQPITEPEQQPNVNSRYRLIGEQERAG